MQMSVTKQIDAPVEKVFERASDLRHAPDHINAIIRMDVLSDGPIGKGTRFRETRMMFKKECTEEMEIVRWDPPHGYDVLAESHGCRYESGFRFAQKNGGTEVTMHFKGTPLTFMAKVMSVLMRPMMKSVLKMCEKDLDDIKRSVEGEASAAT